MAQVGERVFGSDELFLQGRLQLEIARDALKATGANPNAEEKFTTLLLLHEDVPAEVSHVLSIYMQGSWVEEAKTDIIESLQTVKEGDEDQRVEAEGLLQILGVEL